MITLIERHVRIVHTSIPILQITLRLTLRAKMFLPWQETGKQLTLLYLPVLHRCIQTASEIIFKLYHKIRLLSLLLLAMKTM